MKFETRDGKKITIELETKNDEILEILKDAVPRLSYDEILDGELERRLSKSDLGSVRLSSGEDIKQLVFSLAMFNTLSKPTGL